MLEWEKKLSIKKKKFTKHCIIAPISRRISDLAREEGCYS